MTDPLRVPILHRRVSCQHAGRRCLEGTIEAANPNPSFARRTSSRPHAHPGSVVAARVRRLVYPLALWQQVIRPARSRVDRVLQPLRFFDGR